MGEPLAKHPDLSRYENGKIYKIVVNGSDSVYYGSTCTTLTKRMANHRKQYKLWVKDPIKYSKVSSYELFEIGEPEIVLVEDVFCTRNEQLLARERFYIENNTCVNMNVPGRTKAEWYQENTERVAEQRREYFQANADKIGKYQREYKQANIQRLQEQTCEYRQANADKILKQKREYRQANKEKLAEKQREFYHANKDRINARAHDKYAAKKAVAAN